MSCKYITHTLYYLCRCDSFHHSEFKVSAVPHQLSLIRLQHIRRRQRQDHSRCAQWGTNTEIQLQIFWLSLKCHPPESAARGACPTCPLLPPPNFHRKILTYRQNYNASWIRDSDVYDVLLQNFPSNKLLHVA